MSQPEDTTAKLVAILRLAYSGERAAALAYHGHWRSVRSERIRERIRTIEQEELHHRQLVGAMLEDLGFPPSPAREFRASIIGHVLGALCHVAGFVAPMYGAGKLESRNIREYEVAARYAAGCGRHDLVDCLLTMAEVEWDHEAFFRECVETHWLGRRLPMWPRPSPRSSIRESPADSPK